MDRYQRVEKSKKDYSSINENEIRITSQGLIRNYINYATSLLQERQMREIVLKGMGQATSKAVAIAEIIKKRFPRLHQNIIISSSSITDVWEPIEEGLVPLETTRHVSMISIFLSIRELNKNSPGYQAPLHVDQPRPPRPQQRFQQLQQHHPQGPQQHNQPRQMQNQLTEGRGRSRGRGRGWARAGYGGYNGYGGYDGYGNEYENGYGYHQDNGGWNWNWGRGGGRGRGRWDYPGMGYERGRGGNGRGFDHRGRGRMGGRGRARGYQNE